jgi:hypothetical protein
MAQHGGVGPGRFALELDGVHTGWLVSAAGGDAEGVVESEPGNDGVIRKRIGGLRYADLELSVVLPLSKQFSGWVAGTIGRKHVTKNGAVRFVSFDLKEVGRLDFSNALIREVSFQALDATSKELAKLTIKIAPESTKRTEGTGAQVVAPSPNPGRVARASNFRLLIEGIDCRRVTGIGPITIRQKITETAVGGRVDLEPTGFLEIGELVLAVSGDDSDFVAWHKEFVVDGSASATEKKGTLELLAPDLKTVLFTLTFAGLGIFNLKHENVDPERVPRLRAWIYCEEVAFAAAPSVQ